MAEKNTNTWLDTPDPQVFIKNSARFNDLMMMYRCTVREVRTKLEVLNDEFSVEYKRNPISFIKTRIKKPESIYKKLKKLGYDFTAENIQNQLNDVAGIRVVCAFIDDIYTIADLIAKQDDITVIQVKDYIKNPKPNGYRSYHMIVEIPVFFSKGKTPMRAEIQIRTNGMDFWATLEHQLRYKQDIEETVPALSLIWIMKCSESKIKSDGSMISKVKAGKIIILPALFHCSLPGTPAVSYDNVL